MLIRDRLITLIGYIILTLSLFYGLKGTAHANVFAQWGIEPTHPGTKDKSAVKFVEFGGSGEQGKLAYTVGAGGWIDHTGYKAESGIAKSFNTEAHSSLFMEALFGVEPKSDHLYVSYKFGPAIITNTDALLGSNLQCAHEFGIGMRDIRDVRVGFIIKHFSNAGIVRPNKGREFLGLRIEF